MCKNKVLDLSSYDEMGQITSIFGLFLPKHIDEYPNLRVLSSDMSYGARLDQFKEENPSKFINVGIAEQNLIGVAAGLTSEGYKCVTCAQATFISMRSFEQIRQYMSYQQYPIIVVGLSAGFLLQFMGNSHYAMEDISIMRSLPNITVLSPADAGEAVLAFRYALSLNNPVYLRLTGTPDIPSVYTKYFNYSLKSNVLKKGVDIALFATGSMVYTALQVAKILQEEQSLSVGVIDVHCLCPMDTKTIDVFSSCKLFVSLEEHYIEGGLGSIISDYIAGQTGFPPLLKLGIRRQYSEVGDYNYLLEQHGLSVSDVAKTIIDRCNSYNIR